MARELSAPLHHAKVADVLALVVQHCPDFCKLQDICRLLLVSSTIRQQLLRARGHGSMYFATSSPADDAVQRASKMAGFMQWLPRHAGLVKAISLHDFDDAPDVMELAQQLCAQALRLCRFASAAIHDSAAAGEPAFQQLRLCSVLLGLGTSSKDVLQLVPRALLQELAAAQTQKLSCTGGTFGAAAMLQLGTSLQELECEYMECSAAQLLPPSLQVLDTTFVSSSGSESSDEDESSSGSSSGNSGDTCCLDLQHLTQLRELTCGDLQDMSVEDCSLRIKLPAQLTGLHAYVVLHELTGGTGLQSVELLWRSLAGLRSLGSIAGPWQLSLLTGYCDEETQPPAAAAAAATLSTATGLTDLHVRALYPNASTQFAVGCGQLCAALSTLPHLQHLHLQDLDISCERLLTLTALTQLHSLQLRRVAGCDDAVAAMLAGNLTGLTTLMLYSRSIRSPGAGLLAVVGTLTNLRRLSVGGAAEFCVRDKDLLLLSRLTQLTSLAASPLSGSRAGTERFLAGMPRLTSIMRLKNLG